MGKGMPWSDAKVKAHTSVWMEANIQQELDGAVRNKVVYEKIAECLKDAGYHKDWIQCRAKVKTSYKKT